MPRCWRNWRTTGVCGGDSSRSVLARVLEKLLATVLEAFSLQFPDIVVDLRAGSTSEIIAMVRNDEVDLGLCAGGGSDPAIRARTFRAAPLCALVSPQHALAGERRIRIEQLAGQRLIFMQARFGVQQYLDSLIRAERLNLTPAYRCDLFSAAQAIAAAGLGVAFMSTMRRGSIWTPGNSSRSRSIIRSRASLAAR